MKIDLASSGLGRLLALWVRNNSVHSQEKLTNFNKVTKFIEFVCFLLGNSPASELFRRRGKLPRRKHNIQNMAKVLNQEFIEFSFIWLSSLKFVAQITFYFI